MDTWTHARTCTRSCTRTHGHAHAHVARTHTWSRTCTRTRTRTYARANVCSEHARIVSPFQIDLDSCMCSGRSGERLDFDMCAAQKEKEMHVSLYKDMHIYIYTYTHMYIHIHLYIHIHMMTIDSTRCIHKVVPKSMHIQAKIKQDAYTKP